MKNLMSRYYELKWVLEAVDSELMSNENKMQRNKSMVNTHRREAYQELYDDMDKFLLEKKSEVEGSIRKVKDEVEEVIGKMCDMNRVRVDMGKEALWLVSREDMGTNVFDLRMDETDYVEVDMWEHYGDRMVFDMLSQVWK